MEIMNELVTDVTEKVEPTTEEAVETVETPEKVYTEEEFRAKLTEGIDKGVRRREAKIRKEYDRKYGTLESVLKTGTGKESVEEITDSFKTFYEGKGVEFPKEPEYTDKDIKVLAKAEADEIIRSGFDEAVEEADRLNELGVENMTQREKAVFVALTDYIKNTEAVRELAKIGVTEKEYGSAEFKEFASQFNSDTPITKIYEIYSKSKPKKEINPMGSVKSTAAEETVKDYYSFEEASKFTKKDFDKNPALFKAVQNSMRKWK